MKPSTPQNSDKPIGQDGCGCRVTHVLDHMNRVIGVRYDPCPKHFSPLAEVEKEGGDVKT